MLYIQPPWRTRKFFNRFAAAIRLGSTETLSAVGRFSKKPQKIPVSPIEVNGVRYLVPTYGESQWVKNVRANPTITLNSTEYLAAEIPVAARKPILDVFKAKFANYVDEYFRQLPNDADHPVFSLTTQMDQRGCDLQRNGSWRR
ncbi:nitroreductase/quinone reductase family protein [Mycobacterium lentiflavum]|nr:nitroreductase/quinone reductase family protein [Mycobacterium lentiflavum]